MLDVPALLLAVAHFVHVPSPSWHHPIVGAVVAAVGGLFFVVCGGALSVDLPESTRPFSRLSG